jgi:hypothetical protein
VSTGRRVGQGPIRHFLEAIWPSKPITAAGLAINPAIMNENLGYNADKDFAYLHLMAIQPNFVHSPSLRRSASPDIPTFAEMLQGFEVQASFGWIAPTGVVIIDNRAAKDLAFALDRQGGRKEALAFY